MAVILVQSAILNLDGNQQGGEGVSESSELRKEIARVMKESEHAKRMLEDAIKAPGRDYEKLIKKLKQEEERLIAKEVNKRITPVEKGVLIFLLFGLLGFFFAWWLGLGCIFLWLGYFIYVHSKYRRQIIAEKLFPHVV